jgi:ABC-type sugar transport system ATPase subunit
MRQIAAEHPGPVVAGVRPEHVVLRPVAAGEGDGTVELTEPVGPVTYVDFTIGGVSMRTSVPASTALEAGQPVSVGFEPDQFHFFDATRGVRIDIA